MAPKRAKKKKSVDTNRNASIATNEDELRKRVEEAEAQLREEAKLIERMTRDNKQKQEQIQSLETLLQQELEKHETSMAVLDQERLSERLEKEQEIELLKQKVAQLELHVEGYDVMETANATLRTRVESLMNQLESENRSHSEEIHKIKLDTFNHKMALEKTFRKTLQELDADYLQKALNAMSAESKRALIANTKLKDELQLQSHGVDTLMRKFNEQSEENHKLKMTNEILEYNSQLRAQEVTVIKRANLDAKRTIRHLQKESKTIDNQTQHEAVKRIEQLESKNMELQKKVEQAEKRAEKWKLQCGSLTARDRKIQPGSKRAQTAPSGTDVLVKARSQPVIPPAKTLDSFNYDEIWSASLNQQHLLGGTGNMTTNPAKRSKEKLSPLRRIPNEVPQTSM